MQGEPFKGKISPKELAILISTVGETAKEERDATFQNMQY